MSLAIRAKLRRATTTDAPSIITGINEVCGERGYFYTPYYVPTPQWEAALYHPETVPDHLLLVAEVGAQFAGTINLFPHTGQVQNSYTGEAGIFVLRPFRNLGVGSAMMTCALNWARHKGYERVVLSTFATNSRAIHVFTRLGFSVQSVCLNQYQVAGRKVDGLWMQCMLGSAYNARRICGTDAKFA